MPRDRLDVQQLTLPISLTLHMPSISAHDGRTRRRAFVQQSPSLDVSRRGWLSG
jgi:hypothetical protein